MASSSNHTQSSCAYNLIVLPPRILNFLVSKILPIIKLIYQKDPKKKLQKTKFRFFLNKQTAKKTLIHGRYLCMLYSIYFFMFFFVQLVRDSHNIKFPINIVPDKSDVSCVLLCVLACMFSYFLYVSQFFYISVSDCELFRVYVVFYSLF